MSTEKLSQLKAAAIAATPGPWGSVYDDWSDGDDALISSESRDGMVAIAKIKGGGPDSGYDEPFGTEQQANTAFIAAANPAAVLELLAELEDERASRAQWQQNCTRAEERIAELESKLATPVRLPDMRQSVSGDRYQWSDGVFNYKQDAISMLRAAGFTVEGDE